MLSIQAVRGLPRLRAPNAVPCIISFSGQLACHRQFRRRQRRVGTAHPSSNSLDDLQHRRTPPKLVQSSASLTADDAPCCCNDARLNPARRRVASDSSAGPKKYWMANDHFRQELCKGWCAAAMRRFAKLLWTVVKIGQLAAVMTLEGRPTGATETIKSIRCWCRTAVGICGRTLPP